MLPIDNCECGPSGTDVHSPQLVQTTLLDENDVDCLPISEVNGLGPIEFYLAASEEDVYDLRRHRLEVEIKVTKANGTALAADDKVSLVNYTLHSLFSQIDVWINETLVSRQSNTYAYRSYIENQLTYSSGDKKSQLALCNYHKDKGGKMSDYKGGDNPGFDERAKGIAESKVMTLRGCINNEFLRQERFLIPQCSVRIRLIPHPQDFVLMTEHANAFKLSIQSARMEFKKVKLNPTEMLEQAKNLATLPAQYPIRQGIVKTFSIAQGSMQTTKENLFSSVPRRVIIGFVEAAAMNGDVKLNPFDFQHFNLNYLSLYVDGERVPSRPLTPDFTKGKYAREYDLLLQTSSHWNDRTALDMKPFEFAQGHTLFGIPLAPGDSDSVAFQPHKNANIRLELRFKNALAKSIVCVVYGDFENTIEIDQNRMITFMY